MNATRLQTILEQLAAARRVALFTDREITRLMFVRWLVARGRMTS